MRLLISFLLATAIISCNETEKKAGPPPGAAAAMKDTVNYTTIQWLDSTSKNFGKISEGQKLEVSYAFKNTGTKPLVISRVQPSCGCTVAEQPSEAVAPGSEGIIKASFNSEGRTGVNHKTLFVYANTRGSQQQELQFVVEVEKKKW
ncbi:MAG: DUF1573 domain-containing protein [Bacteroidetes bacterium]|nr:DUF1573 domain-containing protein [Bacteroidota bacterium]MBS1973880.1 DUF1573 domain-containing protein [Bacteroidota bacterium]